VARLQRPVAWFVVMLILFIIFVPGAVLGAENGTSARKGGNEDLAQELTNPLADLMTIPIQMNWDRNIGVQNEGRKTQTNIQPVIPFHLSADWNLISRTIVPLIDQNNILPGTGSQFGLGDINLSLFFSPKKPASGGLVWGAGPVFLLPTATDDLLGADKWCVGPTAVALTMRGPWTVGALGNHIWSVGGRGGRSDISSTFMQPFAAYTWPSAWTLSVQSESSYNWKTKDWSVPVNASVSKLVKWGKLPVSLQAGLGYWLVSPNTGPEGWRIRFQANFVLPKLF
jgi:hypothetical protein